MDSPYLRRIPPGWEGVVGDFMDVEFRHYFWQTPYGYPALYGYAPSRNQPLPSKKWKECPTCAYRWSDVHGKDECPKCLNPLTGAAAMRVAGGWKRVPGEVSTFKQRPNSAMESEYGRCSQGGLHSWRFGQCRKCGAAEGEELSNYYELQRRGYHANPWADLGYAPAENYRTAPTKASWPSETLNKANRRAAARNAARPSTADVAAAATAGAEAAAATFAKTPSPSSLSFTRRRPSPLRSALSSSRVRETSPTSGSGGASTARLAPSPETVPVDITFVTGLPAAQAETVDDLLSQRRQAKSEPGESLAQKLERITIFLGLETGLSALLAVEQANDVMGIAAHGSLPKQVDTLLAACLGAKVRL